MKVKIFGLLYDLIFDTASCRRENRRGASNASYLDITIDPSFPISSQEETLLHEIFELIDYNLELGLDHKTIMALGVVMHQVIKDNPRIFSINIPEGEIL